LIGGGGRNRTGVDGFAGRCMTTLPPRQGMALEHLYERVAHSHAAEKAKGKAPPSPLQLTLEREKSLELSTSTLARLRSTN
jgi:hypothetical protein